MWCVRNRIVIQISSSAFGSRNTSSSLAFSCHWLCLLILGVDSPSPPSRQTPCYSFVSLAHEVSNTSSHAFKRRWTFSSPTFAGLVPSARSVAAISPFSIVSEFLHRQVPHLALSSRHQELTKVRGLIYLSALINAQWMWRSLRCWNGFSTVGVILTSSSRLDSIFNFVFWGLLTWHHSNVRVISDLDIF